LKIAVESGNNIRAYQQIVKIEKGLFNPFGHDKALAFRKSYCMLQEPLGEIVGFYENRRLFDNAPQKNRAAGGFAPCPPFTDQKIET
jgi:hypothetical protein